MDVSLTNYISYAILLLAGVTFTYLSQENSSPVIAVLA